MQMNGRLPGRPLGTRVYLGSMEPASPDTRAQVQMLPAAWAGLDAEQQRNVEVIYRVLRGQGVPLKVIQAAIVNARRESNLRAAAAGDNGHSIGLFQLNDRGAGRGMTVAQRKDPAVNTQKIAAEFHGPAGNATRTAYAKGASIAELAALWCRDIERPADKPGEMAKSRTYAKSYFGSLATVGEPIKAEDLPAYKTSGGRGTDKDESTEGSWRLPMALGFLALGGLAVARGTGVL